MTSFEPFLSDAHTSDIIELTHNYIRKLKIDEEFLANGYKATPLLKQNVGLAPNNLHKHLKPFSVKNQQESTLSLGGDTERKFMSVYCCALNHSQFAASVLID